MRYILRGLNSTDGLHNSIIEEIEKRINVEFAIVYDGNAEKNRVERNYLIYRSLHDLYSVAGDERYGNVSLTLDRDLLNAMLPYKDMIMDMMQRETNLDIYFYQELSDLYYTMLAYWYRIVIDNKIDFLIWLVGPHHSNEYMLYALSEVLHIKKMMMTSVWSVGYCVSGVNINSFGNQIAIEYNKLLSENIKDIKLNDELEKLFQSNLAPKKILNPSERKEYIEYGKKMFSFMNYREYIKAPIRVLKWKFWKCPIGCNREELEKASIRKYHLSKRIHLIRKQMEYRKDYERLCKPIDYNKKYIYFGLQFQPEQTTMPNAGEFRNQLISISILSNAAKELGVEIWVKEHWVQWCRKKAFYEKLARIDNVRLIKSSESTDEIINHAMAVATQTGTCIIEGVIKGKPALVFGEGYPYKGAPNVFLISSNQECKNIVNCIWKGEVKETSIIERRLYLKAMENVSILSYTDSIQETSRYYEKSQTSKKIVDIIEEIYSNKDNKDEI